MPDQAAVIDCPVPNQRKLNRGFTLVELLVVIAIIGVLVALLLPAVQSAREAARRTQCANQMRQMSLALQNHESSLKIFPTGGVEPWPTIEDYSAGGKPFAAPKQGLSWAFQLLPYLEQNAVHNISTTAQLRDTPVGLYYCPSRRGPTLRIGANDSQGRWLMDYAGLVGAGTRTSVGDRNDGLYYAGMRSAESFQAALDSGNTCRSNLFWGGATTFVTMGSPTMQNGPNRQIYNTHGVLVRSKYFVNTDTGQSGNPEVLDIGGPGPNGFRQITDGASNTAVLCEKWINVNAYDGSTPADDAGWSDGWDYDTLRLGFCQPASDASQPQGESILTAGSAHTSVFFCAFADGSVHGINYDVDLETFNKLANIHDGEVVDLEF